MSNKKTATSNPCLFAGVQNERKRKMNRNYKCMRYDLFDVYI